MDKVRKKGGKRFFIISFLQEHTIEVMVPVETQTKITDKVRNH